MGRSGQDISHQQAVAPFSNRYRTCPARKTPVPANPRAIAGYDCHCAPERPETRLCWFVDALGDVIAGSLSEKPQVAALWGSCSLPASQLAARRRQQCALDGEEPPKRGPPSGQAQSSTGIGSIGKWPDRSSAAASVHPMPTLRQMTCGRLKDTVDVIG